MTKATGIAVASLAAALLGIATPAHAQNRDSLEIAKLKAQVTAIARELEEMQLGSEIVAVADTSAHGFGPAASKVYKVRQGVSIGGYGELLYENFATDLENGTPAGKTDKLDALRAIIYVGYKFNDRILFNSEIEVEHASSEQAGAVSLEFAYLDYRFTDRFGLRAGLLLSPMGFLNELHEPPTFLGTKRPETEQKIIPSTWREAGVGLFGEVGRLSFRGYLMNGFDAIGGGTSKAEGFSAASGLRGGRQNGSKTVAENFAVVGRVDYAVLPGLSVGTSAYYGKAGQNAPVTADPTRSIDAGTFIWDGHVQYKARGWDLRGLIAVATVDDAAEINAARSFTGAESVGERLVGGYVQVGYDVLWSLRTQHQVIPYIRYEQLNTQDDVPSGFAADPANDLELITLGTAWKPIGNVVFKADYQIRNNEASTGLNQFNLAVGYLF
ncbi:MAG: porin [Gemmatimonadales bacterium]